MKKILLAGSVALSLGISSNAAALTVEVTSMNFGSISSVSGTLSSVFNPSPDPYGSISGIFFSQPWVGHAYEYFDEVGVEQHFASTSPLGSFDYSFLLSEGQVAWGLYFDWSMSNPPPVLNIMDCDENGNGQIETGELCTGIGTPMQSGPFIGQAPSFNGVVTSVVPVPASVWLLGSGLLGLLGLFRGRVLVDKLK